MQLLNITVQLLNIAVQLENNCMATNSKIYISYAIRYEVALKLMGCQLTLSFDGKHGGNPLT